jgi:hypothetical protein
MTRTRRAGLLLAAVGAVLWLLFAAAALSTDPDDGADIGAGLLALVALPLSLGASLALVLSWLAARGDGAATTARASRREGGAAALAVVSVLCLGSFLVLDPYAESDTPRTVVLAVGIVTFLLSSAAFATANRRSPVPSGGRTSRG